MSVEGGSTSSAVGTVAGGITSPEGSSVASSISFGHSFGIDSASQLGGSVSNIGLPSGSLRGFSAEAIFSKPLTPSISRSPESLATPISLSPDLTPSFKDVVSSLTKANLQTLPTPPDLEQVISQTEELALDKFPDPFELNQPEVIDLVEEAKVSILTSKQVRDYIYKDARPTAINQIDVDLPNQVQEDAEEPTPVKGQISFSQTPAELDSKKLDDNLRSENALPESKLLRETTIVQEITEQEDPIEAIEVVVGQADLLDQALDDTTEALAIAPLVLDPEVGAELEQVDKSIESLRAAGFKEQEIENLINYSLERQTLVSQDVKDAVLEQLGRKLFSAKLEVKKLDPQKPKPAHDLVRQRDSDASRSRLGQLKEGAEVNKNPDGTVDAALAAEAVSEQKESNKSRIVRPGGKDYTIGLFKKRIKALGVVDSVWDLNHKAEEIDKELTPVMYKPAPGTDRQATDQEEIRVKFG